MGTGAPLLGLESLPWALPVAVDTETGAYRRPDGLDSALYADSGARVAAVSASWIDPAVVAQGRQAVMHAVQTGEGVIDHAWPFSQGKTIGYDGSLKPDHQMDLFEADGRTQNLGEDAWAQLLVWLMDHQRLVYHNGKFDLEKLRYAPLGWPAAVGGADLQANFHWDTMVAQHELEPGLTSALKPTAARLWGADETAERDALIPYLGPRKRPGYDLVPWEVLQPYAAHDTNLTIRLYYWQLDQLGLLDESGAEIDWEMCAQVRREIAVTRALYRLERAGIPYDAQASLTSAKDLLARQAAIEQQLPFRATEAQAKAWLFGSQQVKGPDGKLSAGCGLSPLGLTDKGQPQLTAEIVAHMCELYTEGRVAHVLRLWQERNKLATAVKMWYSPYGMGVGDDGRLRTCFRQVASGRGDSDGGTRSGRFSVERVNLQAIPHDYRMVAGPEKDWPVPTPRQLIDRAVRKMDGYELWEFDLAQAELRCAAAWSKCTPMLDAIGSGQDLHGITTRELFHIDPSDERWGFYRQIGKRANFSLIFGSGGATFRKMVAKETGVRLGEAEADSLVKQWNRLYPQFHAAIDLWMEVADRTHEVPLASRRGFATGRRRRFARGEDTHKAFNQLVQGSLAEFLKDWLLGALGICDQEGLGWVEGVGWTGLSLTIHDSLVVLLPEGPQGERIAHRIRDYAADLWVPYFGTPDPLGRVATVLGTAEAKPW